MSTEMSTEIYFIYDSHCPWSYACTPLLSRIKKSLPTIKLNLLHSAYYDGDNCVDVKSVNSVEEFSTVRFSMNYKKLAGCDTDSTLCANLLGWVEHKSHNNNLALLEALQHEHFQKNCSLTTEIDVNDIINKFKLSPPKKCLQSKKLAKEAEYALHDLNELQEMIGTQAIPAILLAHNEEIILLNHNLYIGDPESIVDAINIEIAK